MVSNVLPVLTEVGNGSNDIFLGKTQSKQLIHRTLFCLNFEPISERGSRQTHFFTQTSEINSILIDDLFNFFTLYTWGILIYRNLRKGNKKFTVVTVKEFISRDLLFPSVMILEQSVFPAWNFLIAWFGIHAIFAKVATCNGILRKLELAIFGTPPYLEPAIKPPVDNIVFVSSSL